jgi:hypothetical protein
VSTSLPTVPAALATPQAASTAFTARLPQLAGAQTVPLALPAGSRVVAEVVQSQSDGQVLLRLGQTLLAANLPGGAEVGQKLSLVVLSQPGETPLLLMAPPENPEAPQTQLSSVAQLLGRLQQPAEQSGPVRQTAPVWAEPGATSTSQLAGDLQQSVKSSGLFYESHLAAWVQGDLPMPQLLSEPQGQLSPLLQQPAQPAAAASSAAIAQAADLAQALEGEPAAQSAPTQQTPTAPVNPAASPAPGAAHAQAGSATPAAAAPEGGTPRQAPAAAADPAPALRVRQALSAYSGVQAQPVAATPAGSIALPAQLQNLVQQQLATLAQGSVLWAGQVWPGQDMQWSIEPDDQQQGGDAAGAAGWTSVLKLDLPHLGSMVATVHVDSGQHLRVRLQHQAQAGGALQAGSADLRAAVSQAGLQLDELALQPAAQA